jgi:hypothetical protein
MKSLPSTPALLTVARRVVWFKEPADALADPVHFLAYMMTYGTVEDLRAVQDVIGIEDFREVLDHAPPGIFDARSWAYWNLKCGRSPAPPLPVRRGVRSAPSRSVAEQ